MSVIWSLISVVGLICYSDCRCSPTSFYKSCWIRRYPGLYVDLEESQRRGAQILKVYQEETELRCSRACCLTPNFSCNLAVFYYNTTQDSVNCAHLQCWTPESCIQHQRRNVILYNVTKGVDPDLLVFGKHFTTNPRVLPHMSSSRLNVSEPLTSDKRHFNHPPNPPVRSVSPASTSTRKPTNPQQTTEAVPTAHEVQNHLPRCTTQQASTAHETTSDQAILTALPTTDSMPQPHPTPTSQWATSNLLHATPTNSPPYISHTDPPDTTINDTHSSPDPFYTTTVRPSSTVEPLTPILITEAQTSSTSKTLTSQQPSELQTTSPSRTVTKTLDSMTPSPNATQSITELSTTTQQPPPATSLSNISATETHVTSRSKDLRTVTAAQTNVPSQSMTEMTSSYETTQSTVLSPTTAFQPEETTTAILSSSLTNPTSIMMDSQPHPNDTKGYISRNITTDDGPQPNANDSLTSVWHLAANTVLVALATCATITFGCCCSVFVALSWRGRRRRKGRYRTNLRGKRGSMKLIKYVIVRESS